MKPLHLPDFSQVPTVPEQTALKKRIDSNKSKILENLLVEFCIYLSGKGVIDKIEFDYEKEAGKFLKKVGRK